MSYSLTRFAIYETVRDVIGSTSQGPMPFYQKVLLGAFGGRERTYLSPSYCRHYFLLSFAFGRQEHSFVFLSRSCPLSLITITEPNDSSEVQICLHLVSSLGEGVHRLGDVQ